jgi:hypothetical protein
MNSVQYIVFVLTQDCNPNIDDGMQQTAHRAAFWTIVSRNAIMTAITFYNCVKISRRETRRLIYLQE